MEIFESRIGSMGLRIGRDVFPQPQSMGLFLHEIIPIVIASRSDGWVRGEPGRHEKDLHYSTNPGYSVEIKTSSHAKNIFGNRSYAQPATETSRSKDGYFITVNFGKFDADSGQQPSIIRIRFGWLDHSDWKPQKAESGQQASVRPDANKHKLRELFGPPQPARVIRSRQIGTTG